MAILSFCFLWRVYTLGGFLYSVEHMAGGDHVRVNQLKLCAPIHVYTEDALFVDVYEVDNGGIQQVQ